MTTDVHVESIPALDIRLDTPEWFEWLSSQSQFKYIGNSTEMSVKRRASNNKWYARKKVWSSDKGSTPIDLYLGSNEEVTSEKLREINYYFGLESSKFWQWYHSPARKQSKGKGVQDEMYTEEPQLSQTGDKVEELEELRTRLAELEQSNSELQAANQALQKQLSECSLQLESTQRALEREADDAKRYYVLWRRYPDLERKNKRLQEQADAFEAAPLKILEGWIEANAIDLKPRTADKLRAYREYLLRSSREADESDS
jgi:regulator of replication initiation timing